MSSIVSGNTTSSAIAITGDITGNLVLSAKSGIVDLSNNTGAITLPSGNTSQRSANTTNGTIRYNTSNNVIEVYLSGSWANVAHN